MGNLNIRISKDDMSGFLFVLYFCSPIAYSCLYRAFGSTLGSIVYDILFFTLVIFAVQCYRDFIAPIVLYSIVAVLIISTALTHPEYNEWFTHRIYGIDTAFLNTTAAIWAFFIVWIIRDNAILYKYLKLTAWLLFIYYLMHFILFMTRGYWLLYDVDGTQYQSNYSLEFGYDMVFPVSFFGAYAFLKNNKWYYLPFILGVGAILLGGSRGAIVWPVLMFPLMLPLKWHSLDNRNTKVAFVIVVGILGVISYLTYKYFDAITLGLSLLLSNLGISSRTVTSMMSGAFSEANGRDRIYELAIELIKTGGPFGHGVYGDRYVIGSEFRWGYSHNIILEMLVSFGYIGGGIICVSLIVGVIRLYVKTKNIENQIVFIAFFIAMLKLIFSNSFWYTPSFWVIVALILKSFSKNWKNSFNLLSRKG